MRDPACPAGEFASRDGGRRWPSSVHSESEEHQGQRWLQPPLVRWELQDIHLERRYRWEGSEGPEAGGQGRWDGHGDQDIRLDAASDAKCSLHESVDSRYTGRRDTEQRKKRVLSVTLVVGR